MRPFGLIMKWAGCARALMAASAAGLMLAGCTGGGAVGSAPPTSAVAAPVGAPATAKAPRAAVVKVGLILPLSAGGQTMLVAKAMKQAGELALFEFDNPNVQLIVRDGKGTPEGAAAAAREVISAGAELVLGPLFAKSVTAAAAVTQSARVPMIAFSNDNRVAGNGTYLLSFPVEGEVRRIVQFAARRGKLRYAALIPEGSYGDLVQTAFRAAVHQVGGTIGIIERVPSEANAMLQPTKQVKAAVVQAAGAGVPVDALFLPANETMLPTLASLLRYTDMRRQHVQLLGVGGWDYANIGREPALIGGWYAASDPRGWRDFSQRFAKAYGGLPPRVASFVFDAVSLAVTLAPQPYGARFTTANLARASGFTGVDGLFRFRRNGRIERGYAVLEVQKFATSTLDPAPNRFTQAQHLTTAQIPMPSRK